MDQLFADLQKSESPTQRQELVSRALAEGINLNEIREMLDYLESFSNASGSRELPNSRKTARRCRNIGSWTSFFSALIYRYR